MILALGETDLREQPLSSRPRGPGGAAGEQRRQLDVLKSSQLVDQLERLEDEADRVAPQPSQAALCHPLELLACDTQGSLVGGFKAAEQIQQARLAAPARPDDRQAFALGDVEADTVDGSHHRGASAVELAHAAY